MKKLPIFAAQQLKLNIMVTVSSVYLPETVQISSRENLAAVCLNLIRLDESLILGITSVAKPFLSIEGNSQNVIFRFTFVRGVNIDEVLSNIPHDLEYCIKLGK